MEFQVEREPFLRALSRIQAVVERRNTMPILGFTLLEAAAGKLTVSGTDSEVYLRTVLDAVTEEPGLIAVEARKLFEIVRELPEGSLRLRREEGERLLMTAGRARFTLVGMPGAQFPQPPDPGEPLRLRLPAGLLDHMFAKTHFAMSLEEGRFALNGLLLQVEVGEDPGQPARLRMVATDTHRLAMVDHPLEGEGFSPREVIIPRKGVLGARKVLEEGIEEVELAVAERHLQLTLPGISLISKLVDGRFPNYHRVIPVDNAQILTVSREAFHGVVKRMSVLSHEKSRGIRLQISENHMRVTTSNPEQDVAEEELEVAYAGSPIDIGFNARYLQEMIGAVDGDPVTIFLKDGESSVLVKDPLQANTVFVLMPMSV
ncbi:MAG: DNA polymerase III subunit beta [Magnetococcales bacterium]|nr:DNA polymerase III subunit beta [Magnetococcales bacterium]MBF0155629.1 DNA polymerase III subunit beta [Magnetococcales bacterium]